MQETHPSTNALSRTAVSQVLWLAILATVGFILLMGLLSWASELTGGDSGTLSGIDADSALFCDELGQVQGESEGVMQLERDIAGDVLAAGQPRNRQLGGQHHVPDFTAPFRFIQVREDDT